MATFLIPDSKYTIKAGNETRTVNVKIIPDSARADKDICSYIQKGDKVKPTKKLSDGSGKVKGITVHNTEDITVASGTNAAEQYARATFPNGNMNGVVVHYWVWENEIWQQLSDTEQGWHAADGSSRKDGLIKGEKTGGNADTIAVEIIQSKRNEKTEKTAAILIAYLLKKYGLTPETGVYTHNYFYPSKTCPSVLLPVWDEFFGKIKSCYYSSPQEENPQKPQENESIDGFKTGDVVTFTGGDVFISSDAKKPNSKAAKTKAKITLLTKNAHPFHLRAVDENGNFKTGVYGWVDKNTVVKTETKQNFAVGDTVKVKTSATNYYPGGAKIPDWVKTDYNYKISQTTIGGKPVIKGGKTVVLLGEKIDKKTGKTSSSIESWADVDILD